MSNALLTKFVDDPWAMLEKHSPSNARYAATRTASLTAKHVLQAAHLVCRLDAFEPNSKYIPLGILVETNVSHLRGYGLLTRERISSQELADVGPMMTRALVNPSKLWSDSIRPIFEQMRTDDSLRGNLICELARNPMTSFIPIKVADYSIPSSWQEASAKDIEDEVSGTLRQIANLQMKELIALYGVALPESPEYEFKQAA